MDDHRLEDKLDLISDRIQSIDVTLAKQHVILDEHIRRTGLLEKRVEPVEKNMVMFQGFLKFLGMPIGLLTTIAAITEILSYLRK